MPKKKKQSEAGSAWDTFKNRFGNYVVGSLLVIAGPVLSLGAWSAVKEGRASESWPTVQCRISDSKLMETKSRSGGTSYANEVQYSFVVDAKTFTGNQVKIGGKSTSSLAEAEADAKRYAVGATPMVRYNPNDPSRNTLETGGTTANFWVAVAGGPVLFVGGLALLGLGVSRTLAARKKESNEDEDEEEEEERPRSKKKRPADDEDEDEAPRKKSKRRPVEADEEEPPPKKAKRRPSEDDELPRKRRPR